MTRDKRYFQYILNRCHLYLYGRYPKNQLKIECLKKQPESSEPEPTRPKQNVTEWLSETNREKVIITKFNLSIRG